MPENTYYTIYWIDKESIYEGNGTIREQSSQFLWIIRALARKILARDPSARILRITKTEPISFYVENGEVNII